MRSVICVIQYGSYIEEYSHDGEWDEFSFKFLAELVCTHRGEACTALVLL
jgi:hypothetical protein